MANRMSDLIGTLGYWTPIKITELLVFLSVFMIAGEMLSDFRSGGLSYSAKVAVGVAIFYGIIALYWPLSFALTAWFRPNHDWFPIAELIFYLVHSVVAISIAYNGVFGLSDRINYLSPLILAWGAVTAIKAVFVVLSIVRGS